MSDAKQKLDAAAQAITTAIMLIKSERTTIDAFLKECRDMENFGHIVNPTLYRDPERRAVSALLEPIFKAAEAFADSYDAHMRKTKLALAAVEERPSHEPKGKRTVGERSEQQS